jgi:hypothetical protein
MNALTTTAPAPLSSGFALVPRDMREALSLAEMMAKAGFLARELQNPGSALFVIEQSMRWNMSPFAVAMETSFIQGKPMFSGKIVAAAVTSSGAIAGRLSYAYSGAGDDRQVEVSGLIRGEGEPRSVTVKLKDARTANKVWTTQADQQLAYHGSRVWARRHAPEIMLGVYAPEEMDDTPAPPRDVPNLAAGSRQAPPAGSMREVAAQAAADALPILAPDGALKQIAPTRWLAAAGKALAMLETADAVRQWRAAMGEHLAAISERDEMMVVEAERLIADRLAELAPAGDDAAEVDDGWPGPR